jgi:hypothetical protein
MQSVCESAPVSCAAEPAALDNECCYCRAPVPSGRAFCAACESFEFEQSERAYNNEQHELQCQWYHDTLEGGESC